MSEHNHKENSNEPAAQYQAVQAAWRPRLLDGRSEIGNTVDKVLSDTTFKALSARET